MSIACSMSAFKPPMEAACRTIADLGFDTVDLICIGGFGHVVPADLAADFDNRAQAVETILSATGLTPVAANIGVGPHLHDRSDAEANASRLAQVEAVARLMRRLGIRVGSFYPGYRAGDRTWVDVLGDAVITIREMLEIAARYDVRLAVELHYATPFETVEQGARLLDAVPELGVAYDPSHYAMQGIDLRETAPFLDRTVHVHMRDAAPEQMQVACGTGTVDFDWLLSALEARSYTGHFSIEYLAKGDFDIGDSIRKTRDVIAQRRPARD